MLDFCHCIIYNNAMAKRGDDMSPRTGRPVKGNSKRDKSLQLRMSKEELEILDFVQKT